jgi:hypothetical protein
VDEPDVTSARSMAASTSESFSSFLFFSLTCRLSPLHSSTAPRHTQSQVHGHPNTESPARMRWRHVHSRAGPAKNVSGVHSRAPVRALT